MGFYNDEIAPRLVSAVCGAPAARERRRRVVPLAEGRVLEIGMGSGHNLPLYDAGKVEFVWGLEPGRTMRKLAAERVRKAPFEVKWLDLPGEEIPLEDGSADTVLTTFTLCTIPDAQAALAQMRRVLKPGGKLLFLEHGESPDALVHLWQRGIEPVWKPLSGGCHVTRKIPKMIEDAGFSVKRMNQGYLPGIAAKLTAFASYEYWGSATQA